MVEPGAAVAVEPFAGVTAEPVCPDEVALAGLDVVVTPEAPPAGAVPVVAEPLCDCPPPPVKL
jgi:hypothetical protein